MKEVKAYVRPTFLNSIIERLEEKGAKDITVVRVDALGALADQEFDRWHFVRKYDEKYFTVAKLEIVCRDDQAKEFMHTIKEYGHTGEGGDGRVFITNVEDAVNITTGREGEAAL
jgi:nitrogen regulatory protein P-II 1